ncbi:MAG: YbaK/EbsC family protein [Pseudomonadota bacterium]
MAKAVGEKRIFMAPVDKSELVTGYVVGGISALGQKTKLPTVVDSSVQLRETLLISAGKRGHDIELRVTDLLALTNAKVADISIGKAST